MPSFYSLIFFNTLFYACKGLVDNTYPKENTILKHGLFVQNFVISLYANKKIVLELFYHSFCLSCSIQIWLKEKVTCSRRQSEWPLIFIVLWSMMNEMSSLCELLEFIMCLASSLIWIHLITYPNWIENFLQRLVPQNIQYILKQF